MKAPDVGTHNGIFLGLAYNSPPPSCAVELFETPMFPVSTPELSDLPRPAIVLGSMPCERIASAISSQRDVVYLAVLSKTDELRGAESWVDDFIVNPHDHHEICTAGEHALELKKAHYAPRAIVSDKAFAWFGQSVPLSLQQAKIVQRLVRARGAVVSEPELAWDLWGYYIDDPGRAIEAHIYRLRKLLNGLRGVQLQTIRQRGYRLILSRPSDPGAPVPDR